MAHDVFISYAHHDKPQADAVCAALEANGIRCWIAPRDVIPGQEWGAAIVDAIRSSRVMVLVFSSHANASPQISREVERAVSAETVLIPFRIEDVAPAESLEYFLGTPHWLDAMTPPLEAHLDRLVVAVKSFLAVREPIGIGGDSAAVVSATPPSADTPRTDTTSTPAELPVFQRLSRRTKIGMAAGTVVAVVAVVVVVIIVGSHSSSGGGVASPTSTTATPTATVTPTVTLSGDPTKQLLSMVPSGDHCKPWPNKGSALAVVTCDPGVTGLSYLSYSLFRDQAEIDSYLGVGNSIPCSGELQPGLQNWHRATNPQLIEGQFVCFFRGGTGGTLPSLGWSINSQLLVGVAEGPAGGSIDPVYQWWAARYQ